ncbi:MAG: 2-keto-4-pentenoate hydratase [Cenarchaeum symbiont of Oopsacas minuta]|nr:2-keto-4-pentenoate hydratase [Cenarchaeum symbiont of Oopsacas minuta]
MNEMKIARVYDKNTETYCLVRDDRVSTKDEMISNTGIPLPLGIKEFLFEGWFEEIVNKNVDLPYATKLSDVNLLAPIPNPPKIICLAFNYMDHAKEQGKVIPKDPVPVIKPRTALCGSGNHIELVNPIKDLDYEVELALVIGETCKNANLIEAKNAIFGYMIFNDVSARDIQLQDTQFTRAKGFDTFAPCGPWITTADEIENPDNLSLKTRVNGELRQNSSTSMMGVKPYKVVSKLSSAMTLEKGDIISTGTPAGVASGSKKFGYLRGGDVIHMEIEKLGHISNTVKDLRS